MLKKRIAVFVMAFCCSLLLAPAPSHASSLSWIAGPGSLAKLARLWDLLPRLGHPAPAGKPGGMQVKQGCGIDPQGLLTCDPAGGGASGATTTSDPGPGM